MFAFKEIAIVAVASIAIGTCTSPGASHPLAVKAGVPVAAISIRYRTHIVQPNLDVRFRRAPHWGYFGYSNFLYPTYFYWDYPTYIPGFRYGGF
jgi:hypothetical protein